MITLLCNKPTKLTQDQQLEKVLIEINDCMRNALLGQSCTAEDFLSIIVRLDNVIIDLEKALIDKGYHEAILINMLSLLSWKSLSSLYHRPPTSEEITTNVSVLRKLHNQLFSISLLPTPLDDKIENVLYAKALKWGDSFPM